jgi:hypothetical protein
LSLLRISVRSFGDLLYTASCRFDESLMINLYATGCANPAHTR